jgi:hypothetical protein
MKFLNAFGESTEVRSILHRQDDRSPVDEHGQAIQTGPRWRTGIAGWGIASRIDECVIDHHHAGNLARVQAGVQPGHQSSDRESYQYIRTFYSCLLE